MKVLIIEDEELAAKRLKDLITELKPGIIIDGPIDSVQNAVNYLSTHHDYDLLFLDIHLADGMSFNIFSKVDINIPVIFTTAYDEYAIKAFELNSIDYLLKPISKNKLQASFDKLNNINNYFNQNKSFNIGNLIKEIQTIHKPEYKTRFLVNGGNALIPIQSVEICYFMAEDKVVELYTRNNKKYIIPYTLDDLEQKLNPAEFFRVNRQFILSLSSISKIHQHFNYKLKVELLINTTTEIIVSKQRTQAFRNWLNSE